MKDISRRSFLRAATGAVGVGLLASYAPVSAPTAIGNSKIIRADK